MAVKIGDLYFDVSADTAGAQSSIAAVGGAAQQAAGLISSSFTAGFDAVLYAAKTATALIVKDVLSVGASFNIAGQQAVGLFTSLTGSVEEAHSILAEFSQLSLDEPIFDPASLQKTTSLLLTFQVAKEDALELAKNINLTAVALGRGQMGATQLARAIGQIQGRGWLEGDEARQLSEVGVNAYAVIAEAIGKTVSETMELGRQHKLLSEDVIPILNQHLEETFGPVSQNMLKTFGVQAQGIRNIITGIGSALVNPFIGRTEGGVLVEFLTDVRNELGGVIEVADDGTYRLVGALAPLMQISEALADAFKVVGSEFIGFISDASESGGLENVASGIAEAIPMLLNAGMALAEGGAEFFGDLWEEIQPLLPAVADLAVTLFDFGAKALPIIADGFTNLIGVTAPIAGSLIAISTAFLKVASPVILDLLTAVADTLGLIADNIEWLLPLAISLGAAWVAWKAAIIVADVATASFTTITLSALSVELIAIATQAGVLLAVLGSIKAVGAGLSGDVGYLNEDRPFYEKPFQLAGRIGFAATGGDRGLQEQADMVDAAEAAAQSFNLTLLDTATNWEEAKDMANQYATSLGLNETQALHFTNIVTTAWDAARDATQAAAEAARQNIPIFENGLRTFEESLGGAAEGWMRVFHNDGTFIDVPMIEEADDIIKRLGASAKAAADEVDALLSTSPENSITDFLAGLPDVFDDLTKAMQEGGDGILGQIDIDSILSGVTDDAMKVINTLVDDYGYSLDEIEEMFKNGGLLAVIQELILSNGQAAESVDPIIEQYKELGLSADTLKATLKKLNQERDDSLREQIKAVETALDAAKDAAKEAHQALDDYFSGANSGVQGEIDKLVLDIPDVGSQVEAGLLKGGAQGEAMVRQALSGVSESLGGIFQAGLEQGLSPDQIIAMLGPVYGSIQQEIGGALNRVSSLDWTEGFTPGAASEIQSWLAGILDPEQIGDLFANVTNADSAVETLQTQLDELNLQMDVEIVFSPEQVQEAANAAAAETAVDPAIGAAVGQAIVDAIGSVFASEPLAAAIDSQNLTQQILDAAKAAEDQIQLDFNSTLVFDQEALSAMAETVGGQFATIFNQKILEILAEPVSGPVGVPLAPAQTESYLPSTNRNNSVNVNNSIKVTTNSPRQAATEIVAASSAAAGSGGRFTKVGILPKKEAEGD